MNRKWQLKALSVIPQHTQISYTGFIHNKLLNTSDYTDILYNFKCIYIYIDDKKKVYLIFRDFFVWGILCIGVFCVYTYVSLCLSVSLFYSSMKTRSTSNIFANTQLYNKWIIILKKWDSIRQYQLNKSKHFVRL